VLIADRLARTRFGDPADAVGKTLTTTADPLVIVGVMPATFRFPTADAQIWRALDPRGDLARGFVGISSIARMQPGQTLETLSRSLEQRSPSVAAASRGPATYSAFAAPLTLGTFSSEQQRRLFLVLLAAAGCLL